MCKYEAAFFYLHLELVVSLYGACHGLAEFEGFLEYVALDFLQEALHVVLYSFERYYGLFERVAAHDLYGSVGYVAGSEYEAHGDTLQLVVGKLESGTLIVGIVVFDRYVACPQIVDYRSHHLVYFGKLLGVFRNRYDDHLYRGEVGWEYESVVVAVGHDECAHKACRYTP